MNILVRNWIKNFLIEIKLSNKFLRSNYFKFNFIGLLHEYFDDYLIVIFVDMWKTDVIYWRWEVNKYLFGTNTRQ